MKHYILLCIIILTNHQLVLPAQMAVSISSNQAQIVHQNAISQQITTLRDQILYAHCIDLAEAQETSLKLGQEVEELIKNSPQPLSNDARTELENLKLTCHNVAENLCSLISNERLNNSKEQPIAAIQKIYADLKKIETTMHELQNSANQSDNNSPLANISEQLQGIFNKISESLAKNVIPLPNAVEIWATAYHLADKCDTLIAQSLASQPTTTDHDLQQALPERMQTFHNHVKTAFGKYALCAWDIFIPECSDEKIERISTEIMNWRGEKKPSNPSTYDPQSLTRNLEKHGLFLNNTNPWKQRAVMCTCMESLEQEQQSLMQTIIKIQELSTIKLVSTTEPMLNCLQLLVTKEFEDQRWFSERHPFITAGGIAIAGCSATWFALAACKAYALHHATATAITAAHNASRWNQLLQLVHILPKQPIPVPQTYWQLFCQTNKYLAQKVTHHLYRAGTYLKDTATSTVSNTTQNLVYGDLDTKIETVIHLRRMYKNYTTIKKGVELIPFERVQKILTLSSLLALLSNQHPYIMAATRLMRLASPYTPPHSKFDLSHAIITH